MRGLRFAFGISLLFFAIHSMRGQTCLATESLFTVTGIHQVGSRTQLVATGKAEIYATDAYDHELNFSDAVGPVTFTHRQLTVINGVIAAFCIPRSDAQQPYVYYHFTAQNAAGKVLIDVSRISITDPTFDLKNYTYPNNGSSGPPSSTVNTIDNTARGMAANAQTTADNAASAASAAQTTANSASSAASAAQSTANAASSTASSAATTAADALAAANGKVSKSGDTMTGPLVLPGAPTATNQASTKGYTDDQVSTREVAANKGQANGYASLDSGGHIPLGQLPAALQGALSFVGVWDANANSPTITSGTGTKGAYYKVSVAGNTTIDGNTGWHVGDMLIFDGTAWDKVDNYESVNTVFGRTGNVLLTLADVTGALSYTPANKAGETFTGGIIVPSMLVGSGGFLYNSGSNQIQILGGSGGGEIVKAGGTPLWEWDANGNLDLLGNGIHGVADPRPGQEQDVATANYVDAQIATRQPSLGFTPVQQGTGIAQLPNLVKIGWKNPGVLGLTVDNTDEGNFCLTSVLCNGYQAALGYTPANKAGETFTGSVVVPSLQVGSGGLLYNSGSNQVQILGGSGGGEIVKAGGTPLWEWDANGNMDLLGNGIHNVADPRPGQEQDAATANYVDAQIDTRQPLLTYTPYNRAGDTLTGNMDAGGFFIGNLPDPLSAQDAATRHYVDNAVVTGVSYSDVTSAYDFNQDNVNASGHRVHLYATGQDTSGGHSMLMDCSVDGNYISSAAYGATTAGARFTVECDVPAGSTWHITTYNSGGFTSPTKVVIKYAGY